ncbi:MAG: efflux RND transporter permease subunit [Gemmataceae bacterium]|nr:efflux RND transporter permease subunit [Gemmataceae bacterium]
MTLSDLSIRNPVFAVMVSAALIVFGAIAYKGLGISQFPELDFPVVSIHTTRESASPEIMDFDVTDVIEDAVSSVEGIDYIQSQSLQGSAITTVFFHLDRNIDSAMQDVQNAVASAMNRLPTDIDPPVVSKVNFNKFPIIWLGVHGPRSLQDINRFVDDVLKQQIQTIPGCGGVMYGGLRPRNMRIWVDQEKLDSFHIDILDVFRALQMEHMEKPAGYLKSGKREINVRLMGEARNPKEFEDLPIVSRPDGAVIYLKDIAILEDGMTDRRSFSRFNYENTVGVGAMRATGANVVQVCDEVKRRLPMLRAMAPPGIEIGISTDFSLFIKDDIEEVQHALSLGIILTAIVALMFLGSLGSTMNVCVSIPVSILGTFVVMKWAGFTLNFMTLLGLSLSVGVVVDDAILVLENIYRRMERGESRMAAAKDGANEIGFAALASTLAIVAIFVPVAFMKGVVGQFFFQFGITVTVAVLISLVVSLTVTPMLASLFLNLHEEILTKPKPLAGPLARPIGLALWLWWAVDRFLIYPIFVLPTIFLVQKLEHRYKAVLCFAVRRPIAVILMASALAGLFSLVLTGLTLPLPNWLAQQTGTPALVIKPIGNELVPSEDQNRFVVNAICPVGVSLDYVNEMLMKCETNLSSLKDPTHGGDLIASMFSSVSIRPGMLISEGIVFVRLVPIHQRTVSQTRVIQETRKKLASIPGMRPIVLDLSTQGFTPSRGYPVDFALQGTDWDTVVAYAEKVKQRVTDSGLLTDVNSDYRPGMPEVQLFPERNKTDALNVPVRKLAFLLNVAFGGVRNGRFSDDDRRYDVRMRLLEDQRNTPGLLDRLQIRPEVPLSKTSNGPTIPVKDLSSYQTVSTLPLINRYNHLRKVEITANMGPGVSQGTAIARCKEIAEEVRLEMNLPSSYRVVQLGNAKAMQQTIDSMWNSLMFGFAVAYMILGIQFNSFLHPLTVLWSVPFGITGGLLVLWISGDTLNLMSMIGLVLLAGLVKKNSIILVDCANQLRIKGAELRDSMIQAGAIRLRPILMTSIATIAGVVPMAIGFGPGAENRGPLARCIIGGIFLSTLITLVVVPAFYVLLERFSQWLNSLKQEPAMAMTLEKHTSGCPAAEPPAAAKE